MLVSIITCTKRWGGIDVLVDSLRRQTIFDHLRRAGDIEWIISDEMLGERDGGWVTAYRELGIPYDAEKPDDYPYPTFGKLERSRNRCLERAEGHYLFLLDDFLWLPNDCLERMIDAQEKYDDLALVNCISHHGVVPSRDQVVYPEGAYSLFDRNFDAAEWGFPHVPTEWTDPRVAGPAVSRDPFQWEASVGLVRRDLVEKAGGWNEDFDLGSAYDNTQLAYAVLANEPEAQVVTLTDVVCVHLPHYHYAPNRPDHDDWGRKNRDRFTTYCYDQTLHGKKVFDLPPKPSVAVWLPDFPRWSETVDFIALSDSAYAHCLQYVQAMSNRGWHVTVFNNDPTTFYGQQVVWRKAERQLENAAAYDLVVNENDILWSEVPA